MLNIVQRSSRFVENLSFTSINGHDIALGLGQKSGNKPGHVFKTHNACLCIARRTFVLHIVGRKNDTKTKRGALAKEKGPVITAAMQNIQQVVFPRGHPP